MINTFHEKIRTLSVFIGISVLIHLLLLFPLGRFGNYNFVAPIKPLPAVIIDLARQSEDAAPTVSNNAEKNNLEGNAAEDVTDAGNPAQEREADFNAPPSAMVEKPVKQKPDEPAAITRENAVSPARNNEQQTNPLQPASQPTALVTGNAAPFRAVTDFITAKSEKLSYLISLLGVPVGTAELEAINKNGELWITLKTRSNAAMSNIYLIDDIIETRHINGNFIISKLQQHEGNFKSDIRFTLFLSDKRVFWIDRIRNRYSNETIPNSDVLDTLSSFYYLRNRPLQVGDTEILHIYDGDNYAPVPVKVVRQEQIRLRNFKKVETLLLHHDQQKGVIFKRIGDISVWVTNDGNKVPVKIETTTPLGSVTVELTSAESQLFDNFGI